MLSPSKCLILGLALLSVVALYRLQENSGHTPLMQAGNSHLQSRSLLKQKETLRFQHPDTTFTPIHTGSEKGYALSLQYPGQQGAGIRALASFQCFLGSVTSRLAIVEPYFEGTKLRGVTSLEDKIELSSLFNLENFNTASKNVGYPELATVKDFTQNRPRPVVVVKTQHNQGNKLIWSAPTLTETAGPTEMKCVTPSDLSFLPDPEQTLIRLVSTSLQQMESRSACVVRIVSLDIAVKYVERSSIQSFIYGRLQPKDATVVFDNWSGPYSLHVRHAAHKMNCKRNFINNGAENQFLPSQQLIDDAERYKKTYLSENNTIAVMFRMEKITSSANGAGKPTNVKYDVHKIEECLDQVTQLQKSLVANTNAMPFITLDVGRFGSDSFKGDTTELVTAANSILAGLTRNKWTVQEWEESFAHASGGEKNRSYMSALQRTLASQGDCLVLVGGGNFQALALQDYVRRHRRPSVRSGSLGGSVGRKAELCIRVLCASKKNEALIGRILQRYRSYS